MPSPRRCEELPWHLKKCYKWHPLKNTLVDLKTFETMWNTTQLRRELMLYWKLLTEGPLHVSEKAEAARAEEDNKARLLNLMIRESSNRGAGGALVTAADIFSLSGRLSTADKVAPFDLVFEYNHAVEAWQVDGRPTIFHLGDMVNKIGDFMREMSQLLQKEYASPPFLHMPLDFKNLEGIGVDPEMVAMTGVEPCGSGASKFKERVRDEGTRNIDEELSQPKGAPKDQLNHYRAVPFYYFQQRWIWVQFPWMALASNGYSWTKEGVSGGNGRHGIATGRKGPGTRLEGSLESGSGLYWTIKRMDPLNGPSVNISKDRMKSRVRAHLGRSAMSTLVDTRSFSDLLTNVSTGMSSPSSNRRHASRALTEQHLTAKISTRSMVSRTRKPRESSESMGSFPSHFFKGSGGRGGTMSDDYGDRGLSNAIILYPWKLEFPSPKYKDLVYVIALGHCRFFSSHLGQENGRRGGSRQQGLKGGKGCHKAMRGDLRGRKGEVWGDPRQVASIFPGTNLLSPLPGKSLVEVQSFLSSSTSIFPMSIDEERVAQAKDMTRKLRQVHDVLQMEIAQK
ncbi:unnamed protein product, partial [Choristocarpus tenellus]